MEEKYSINEILDAVNEINDVKDNSPKKSKIDNSNIPANTLKLIEQAEKSKN